MPGQLFPGRQDFNRPSTSQTGARNMTSRHLKRASRLANRGAVLALAALTLGQFSTQAVAQLSAVWANDGGDKVLQDELRAATGRTTNSVWDGRQVRLFAAHNEIVSFNLVLESAQGAQDVSVQFRELAGPSGYRIATREAKGDDVFNYVGRNIEVFYVRYLQVLGLSRLAYDRYDERHVPSRMRRPFTVDANNRTIATGGWSSRPGADKFFPDIAVPIELQPSFAIAPAQNQSVWVDVYVPKDAPTGRYSGTVEITVRGAAKITVPVALEVLGFALPDQPTARTMLALDPYDVAQRFTKKRFPDPGNPEYAQAIAARDRYVLLGRRHRVTMIGGEFPGELHDAIAPPGASYQAMLRGDFFTAKNGYDGPGTGTPLDLYVIGTYGSAKWSRGDAATVNKRMDEWENYFRKNFPNVDRFLYDIDEPNLKDASIVNELNRRLQVYKSNPGVGRNLKIFTTVYVDQGMDKVPNYDIMGQWTAVGVTDKVQSAVDSLRRRGGQVFQYNGIRPGSGSFAIEDDGTAPRMIPWAQTKLGIDRHFYFLANYYNDYQTSGKQNNVFRYARTYGMDAQYDPAIGRTGWNYSNGEGVLMYPGKDELFPQDSYGRMGAFASLRLKHWRRGIQDADYIALAQRVDAKRTAAIVERMVPRVFWEVGVEDLSDPTWKLGDISWSADPDDWDRARRELASIIAGGAASDATSEKPAPPANLKVH